MNWGKLALLTASALTMAACGTSSQQAPATDAVTSTSPTSTATPITYVTLPDTYGQNAEIARAKLQDLGLTKVELESSNKKYPTVDVASEWKVAGMEPGAGTVVKFDQPVILKVVKVQ